MQLQCVKCGCFPQDCENSKSPRKCTNCTLEECCCWHLNKIIKNQDVLIIEDSRSATKFIEECLKTLGCNKVHTCANGSSGIKKFQELVSSKNIPLVFLDFYLPDKSAVSVFEQLIKTHPRTRIIVETVAGKDVEGIEHLIQQGAYYYLQKPLSFESLQDVMKSFAKEQLFLKRK